MVGDAGNGVDVRHLRQDVARCLACPPLRPQSVPHTTREAEAMLVEGVGYTEGPLLGGRRMPRDGDVGYTGSANAH